ncbi:MAG: MlaE family ABC transporter permease [bacterium]
MAEARVQIDKSQDIWLISASGDWVLSDPLLVVDQELRRFATQAIGRKIHIDISNVSRIDTAGALSLQRTLRSCETRDDIDLKAAFIGGDENIRDLLSKTSEYLMPCESEAKRRLAIWAVLERVGLGAENIVKEAVQIVNFIGMVIAGFARIVKDPRRFRLTAMVHHMEEAGLNATLIVGLMSFLIGAVIAFMGAKVLQQFGATIFTVELIGITVLREFGVLLTAILIAGRSGSAFTAQIGSMKLREEIDAMSAMGIDPLEALILPRTMAMILVLPVLAFLAAMLGLLGGGLTAWLAMDISPNLFLSRTQNTIVLENFWVGLVKAPVFAFFISVIGCFQGMMVRSSAEDLGRKVTTSVVQSLFLVILMDALFAIFFLELNI